MLLLSRYKYVIPLTLLIVLISLFLLISYIDTISIVYCQKILGKPSFQCYDEQLEKLAVGSGELCSGGHLTQEDIIRLKLKICKKGYHCGGGATMIDGPGICMPEGIYR